MYKILLIDDDQDLLTGVSKLLIKNKYEVQALTGTRNLHTIISHFKPHVILLDVFLGHEDGRDVCIQLKENPSTKDIRIILYSSFSDANDTYQVYGANGFLLKPFTSAQLLQAIEQQLPFAP